MSAVNNTTTTSLQSNNPSHLLHYELWRLSTFSKYPQLATKSAILLASNGFVYNGTGKDWDDSVMCRFCHLKKKNWQPEEDIFKVHLQLSPRCPFLTQKNMLNIPFQRNGVSSIHHLIEAAPPTAQLTSQSSAQSSAQSTAQPTAQSRGQSTELSTEQSKQKLSSGSVLQPVTRESDSEISRERPNHIQYANLANRLSSFVKWPQEHHIHPIQLATAGFYFTGDGDCARCFYCGGGLRNWDEEDDVWEEHARWFPKCAFLLQEKGHDFVHHTRRPGVAAAHVQELTTVSAGARNATQGATACQESSDSCTAPGGRSQAPAQITRGSNRRLRERVRARSDCGPNNVINQGIVERAFGIYPSPRIENSRFLIYSRRIASYPVVLVPADIRPILADAGFYFAGRGPSLDIVCFCCGGQLWNVTPGADVYYLHALYFPHCVYIRCILGVHYIHAVNDMISSRVQQQVRTNRSRVVPDHNRHYQYEWTSGRPTIFRCLLCNSRRRSIQFYPCHHLLFCLCCGFNLRVCPVCGLQVISIGYVIQTG
ncbi:inhibitor of apoptosis protein [Biomphalaria pfeifferi]|uniref:Inhibitor of apoptosis protein n=1 Tax=Biomphalaria pfeifferi TaxID=112525 RepID=A0AAD8F706_BIOPF|nr:inhibitor of apoptosis protein [Biomphalaria pfeifferi]